jgi:NitT/TauT family transport system substrate-binding protein
MRPHRSLFALAAASAILGAAAAGPSAAQSPKPWRHGILEAKADAGFIMMADKGGFAEKRGLKMETLQVKAGATLVKALIAGELESVEMGAGEVIVPAARGADVKLIGCSWPGLPQVVMAKAEIKTPQDLKGKVIAISAPGSLPHLLGRVVLDSFNIADGEVKFASIGADLDRYKSLAAGVVDAAVVSNEFEPIAPPSVKVLVRGHELLPKFMRLCFATTGTVLAERRPDLVQLLAAEIEAYRHAASHRDEAVKLTRATTGMKPDDPRPEFIYDQALKDQQIDPALPLPLDKIAWMEEQFVKAGILPKSIDAAKMIDPTIREEALKLVGK